jgi:Asp-tRNA(Asn)/Glu-tRNA(Gln) amidotransferase A subunit family amidase
MRLSGPLRLDSLEDHAQAPTMHARSVARRPESGAVLLAKTTMCDFAMMSCGYSSKFGPTRKPWGSVANQGA